MKNVQRVGVTLLRRTKLQFSAVINISFPNDSTLLEKFEIYIPPLVVTCLFTESAWPQELRANSRSSASFSLALYKSAFIKVYQ